jgi:exosortase J
MKKVVEANSMRRAKGDAPLARRTPWHSFSSGPVATLRTKTPELDIVLISFLVVVGSLALWPLWLHIVRIWTSDSLRVIGAAFPVISFVGVLAAWRQLGWRTDGSFWGILPLALGVRLAQAIAISPIFSMSQGGYWLEVHGGPLLFLYGVGAALLFGGWRLLRLAILPLSLLLCINPIPTTFNRLFDMPLQELSASTARAFAHLIGLHPTGVQLRMMFAPDFGMMIVPGCNGIRGSITLAYLALIYGYTRHLRMRTLALIGPVALLSGYVLNLLRLCILVVYYRIGLSVPSIQNYGAEVDYVIGCTVFLTATIGLGFLVRSLEPKTDPLAPSAEVPVVRNLQTNSRLFAALRALCFIAITIVPAMHARALFSSDLFQRPTEASLIQKLPATVGSFKLIRTYSEQQYATGGPVMFVLGDYVGPADQNGVPRQITMALYVASGYHRVIDSKLLQGQKPVWTASLDAPLNSSQTVPYGTSLYDDGMKRQFNAETTCTEKTCWNPLLDYQQFSIKSYLPQQSGKYLPIVLRGEWLDSDPIATDVLRQRFEDDVRLFTRQLSVNGLVATAGTVAE